MVFGLAGGDLDILHHSIADMNDPAFKKSHLFILIHMCHTQGFLEELPSSGWSLPLQGWEEWERNRQRKIT